MNVILRHGFLNNTNSGVILSCCRKLVDYYVQNNFVLNDNISNAFNTVPLRVIKIISAEHLYKKYFVITCYIAIPSGVNTFKGVTICNLLHTEFSSIYYNDKGYGFRYIFGKYINLYAREIYHPELIQ